MNAEALLEIDTVDVDIINYFLSEPEISHSRVARRVNKSQPAVGARIKKLEAKSLIKSMYGINLSKAGFTIAFISLQAMNPDKIIDEMRRCPFVINALRLIGQYNVQIWLAATSIERIENIVEGNIRSVDGISRVMMQVWIEPIGDLVAPVNLNMEHHLHLKCGPDCKNLAKDHEFLRGYLDCTAGKNKGGSKDGELLEKQFNIDLDDKLIVMKLQDDPSITFSLIGEQIDKSQPAVGARIAKMKKRNFMAFKRGVNFKTSKDLHLVQVSIAATDSSLLIESLKKCEYILFGFKTLGEKSLIAYAGTHSIEHLEMELDKCIRALPSVRALETSVVVSCMKDLVLPYQPAHECFVCNYDKVPISKGEQAIA
ncbi:winged helix-turn-helix transcriptional regulator [Candidatus Bathyarchaeota archaeon]|nr:winged helix-turn-helix transcriptional regulator [Candidatus Bathyarchaeota archaeon]